jgi:hypothetical protein
MKMRAPLTAGIALVMAMMADASPVESPDKGSPLRRAILDGLRATRPMEQLSQAWHAKVVFTDVQIRRSGDWAWISATPMSEKDSMNKTESYSGVMRNSQGWTLVEFLSDSIPSADDPAKEFRSWRAEFMKKHPQCPAAIFPPKF